MEIIKFNMEITKFGKVVVTQRNGEPRIQIQGFEAEGDPIFIEHAVALYAIQYAAKALLAALPPAVASQIRGEMK